MKSQKLCEIDTLNSTLETCKGTCRGTWVYVTIKFRQFLSDAIIATSLPKVQGLYYKIIGLLREN